ncbi:MaoC family dehydratase N-terminal domain-containing protein [Neobacillus niacini]|uniref:MaoC family dehydratase N-terminal domain-containing protein n=1 Tax=Neobacillus niacini TaxID=86668 RepID=UPI0021CB4419|nr:MaoC family dehydratase N-terminal domain-containing protein [Neobacillus niacini]MCM3766195.1 MaoC family dehydratase N-terminal domain-containing protein [Neobacillus niacini]
MSLRDKVGIHFEPFTFEIEKGKIKEFAMAIGDANPCYQAGEALPPTFATVIEMWGGTDFIELAEKLELELPKVLHGEQEYEYLGKIKVGERVTGVTSVTNAISKENMDLIKLETHYKNEAGELVLISRNTVIERH